MKFYFCAFQMSIPKSKILNGNALNVSRGVMALAKVKRDSNVNSQSQTVNISIKPTPDGDGLIVNKDGVSTVVDRSEIVEVSVGENTGETVERTIDSAAQTVTDVESLVAEKEAVNKALSLILDLVESNPLVISKVIVANESVFTELIQVLTQADSIEIGFHETDIGCCGAAFDDWSLVDQVYITKDSTTTNLKYEHPDVIKLLDSHKISYKMLVRDQ